MQKHTRETFFCRFLKRIDKQANKDKQHTRDKNEGLFDFLRNLLYWFYLILPA